jgi:hypothetical protein
MNPDIKNTTTGNDLQRSLNIVLQKELTTYLNFSTILCAILWDENRVPWFYEHFTQLYGMDAYEGFYWNDYLEDVYFTKDIGDLEFYDSAAMSGIINIVEFIEEKIIQGYYPAIYIDEFYLPGKEFYQIKHFMRLLLFYGFDSSNKAFSVIGFNENAEFKLLQYKYQEIQAAFDSSKNIYDISPIWVKFYNCTLLKLKKSDGKYSYDCNKFFNQLNNYLNSSGDSSMLRPEVKIQFGDKASFGIQVYDGMITNLNNLLDDIFTIDYRRIHLIAEHKKLLLKKLSYNCNFLGITDDLLNDFKPIVKNWDEIRINYLLNAYKDSNYKTIYGQLKIKKFIKKIIDKIQILKNQELTVLSDIYGKFMNSK